MKSTSFIHALIVVHFVAACSSPSLSHFGPSEGAAPVFAAPDVVSVQTLDPTPPPEPPKTARTASEFDTTSQEDRAAALTKTGSAELKLGTTLATLGSPADPGIWLKTPLVDRLVMGRVTYGAASVNLELRPSGGVSGSGSQISLPAMRLLKAPLTEIVELTVFKGD